MAEADDLPTLEIEQEEELVSFADITAAKEKECRATLANPMLVPIDDNEFPTHSSEEQKIVEQKVGNLIRNWMSQQPQWHRTTELNLADHQYYLVRGLHHLPEYFCGLDASRPWIAYWILHSLELLGTLHQLPDSVVDRCVDFLGRCQHPNGGFGGGPGQAPHLAATYAAVNALCILGSECKREDAFRVIDRHKLFDFIVSVKCPITKAFAVQIGGEIDTRGSYLALAVASLTNILSPKITEGTATWLASCQRYEGGFGGEPGNEAHGGYTFCALGALMIMNRTDLIDVDNVLRWAAQRQMGYEGGFQGRTNKLVDGCYSFWVGSLFPLISYLKVQAQTSNHNNPPNDNQNNQNKDEEHKENHTDHLRWLLDQWSLQRYILVCCQGARGGLKDKPGKSPDFYHTCYCLSGLSVAQHYDGQGGKEEKSVMGVDLNGLRPVNSLYNIESSNLQTAMDFYAAAPEICPNLIGANLTPEKIPQELSKLNL